MANLRTWAVTGTGGFLGSQIVELLRERGVPVMAVDNLAWGRPEFLARHERDPAFTLERLDVRQTDAFTALLRRHNPAAVVHLAALHFIPAAVADPPQAVSINVLGTQSVLSACRAAGVEALWFASTGDVYAPADMAHAETDAIAPFNVYGLSKLIREAVQGVVDSLEAAPPGVTTVNVATGEAGSMEEVLGQIGELRGRPLGIETDPAKVHLVEPNHLQADVAPLRDLIGWAPHADLRRGLRELLTAEGVER